MADYDYTKITYESVLLLVASTFGNGEAPENGKLFTEMVNEYKKHLSQHPRMQARKLLRQGSTQHDRPL